MNTAVREIPTAATAAHRMRLQGRFLKGPIPMDRLSRAAKLPGQALSVYLAVQHRTDLTRQSWVALPKGLLSDLGVSRDAKSRALRELEAASLVRVRQVKGRAALVCLNLEDEPSSAAQVPWENKQWRVTEAGISSKAVPYEIPVGQLCEPRQVHGYQGIAMWPLQVAEKSWANVDDFIEAFQHALETLRPTGWEALDLSTTFGIAREAASR